MQKKDFTKKKIIKNKLDIEVEMIQHSNKFV